MDELNWNLVIPNRTTLLIWTPSGLSEENNMAFRNRLGARTGLVLTGLTIFAIAMLPRLVSSRLVYGPLLDRLRAENFKLKVLLGF